LQRIWKYKFHYAIVLPALLLILIMKGFPLFAVFRMAFTDFNPFLGLMGSPWAGWHHFAELWESADFGRILVNTLRLKLLYLLLCGALALVLSLAVSGIKSRRIRNVFQTVFLLPYVIPTLVIANIAMLLVSPAQSPIFRMEKLVLGEPTTWVAAFLCAELVSTVGIPVLLAVAAIQAAQAGAVGHEFGRKSYRAGHIVPAARAILAFMLLQVSTLLSIDPELVSALYNPLVYEAADTIDTYGYRTGLFQAEFSSASALWITQFVIQLILTVIVYLLVRRWFLRDLFIRREPAPQPSAWDGGRTDSRAADADGVRADRSIGSDTDGLNASRSVSGAAAGWLVTSAYSLIVLIPLYFLIVYPFAVPGDSDAHAGQVLAPDIYFFYLISTLGVVIVYMMMTLTLAYPLTVKDLPGRSIYKSFLLVILAIGSGGIHDYLFFKELGMVNTVFAPLFSGLISIIGVFVLKSVFNRNYSELKERASEQGRGEMHTFFTLFVPKVWKPLLALGALQFITIWNAYQPSVIYLAQPDIHSPVGMLYTLVMAGPESDIAPAVLLKIGLIASLPAIVLFLLFRKWLTSELFVNEVRKL
jgi:ABC-type polysaccharide transport system permease subunit/ABC-type glycerol-3-phosphate transport system permease component